MLLGQSNKGIYNETIVLWPLNRFWYMKSKSYKPDGKPKFPYTFGGGDLLGHLHTAESTTPEFEHFVFLCSILAIVDLMAST